MAISSLLELLRFLCFVVVEADAEQEVRDGDFSAGDWGVGRVVVVG